MSNRRTLLAHEMAHVFQFAVGKHRYALTDDDVEGRAFDVINKRYLGEEGRVELHADETILRWGYDPLAGLTWIVQNTDEKEGVLKIRKRPLNYQRSLQKAKARQRFAYYKSLFN